MEESILISTKKVLGVATDYTVFDIDIINFINSAFSSLNQLGVGPIDGFVIEDENAKWTDLELPINQASMVKTYIFLKTRMLFDPPATSYLIDATKEQIVEHEWRLNVFRDPVYEETPVEEEV